LVKENRLKTLKDLLMMNKIKVDEVIFRSTGHNILLESIVMNRYEIFVLAIHYNGNNKLDIDS
jgi:hypothetical protein